MMNKKLNEENHHILQILKNRPGLSASNQYKEDLKNRLLDASVREKRRKTLKSLIPNLALYFFIILCLYGLQQIVTSDFGTSPGVQPNTNPPLKEAGENSSQNDRPITDETSETPNSEEPIFVLTNMEKEIYHNFSKDLNNKHLENVQPISIAKLYIHAEIEKQYDVAYALYTDREELVLWSEEEDREIPLSDRPSAETLYKQYKNIDQGNFIQTSEFEGYIEFYPHENSQQMAGFKMIKNTDGVWQVSFLPIQ